MNKRDAEVMLAGVVAELKVSHPDFEWTFSAWESAGGGAVLEVWVQVQVQGFDEVRGRHVRVANGRWATCRLAAPPSVGVSEHFERNLANAYSTTGYGETLHEAIQRALEGFGERWESDAANRAWWAARLRERRAELEAEVAELGEAIDALEVRSE